MAARLNMKMKVKRGSKLEEKATTPNIEFDTSLLSKPFETSINNIHKVLNLFQNGTKEIQDYITYECDVLYECRICRSIFRSISNFFLHKRKYCLKKFCQVTFNRLAKENDYFLEIIQKEFKETKDSEQNQHNKVKTNKSLDSIINNLTEKRKLDSEIETMFEGNDNENKIEKTDEKHDSVSEKKLNLECIDGSSSGMFQSLTEANSKSENMKLEVMELHNLTEEQTATLGPDGQIKKQKSVLTVEALKNIDNSLTCPKCEINFSTRKTLRTHINYKHRNNRIMYPCLECSEVFSTIWSVYRHLYNIHRKTTAEVKKLRPKIKAKAHQKDYTKIKIEEKSTEKQATGQQKIDEDNQAWMDNFECDNDIQMCGGCGRRFERKAALNSHSQMCQKRIAARNLITANKQKRNLAAEDKNAEKKFSSKLNKDDSESEKKFVNDAKEHVAKKRKIVLRYDYCKSNLASAKTSSECEGNSSKRKVNENNDNKVSSEFEGNSANRKSNEKVDINKKSANDSKESIENEFDNSADNNFNNNELEIVSIRSTNSTPINEEKDPLSLTDMQCASDSEVDLFMEPIQNDTNEQFTLEGINKNALDMIKIINSDLTNDSKPTLDEKMVDYVNLKTFNCVPCKIKFKSISQLRNHMAYHFNWARFRCDLCTFKAYENIDVVEHIKNQHQIFKNDLIEAVILEIPEWETVNMSFDVFTPIDSNSSDPLCIEENQENNKQSSPGESSDSCILIENESTNIIKEKKQIKKRKMLTKMKRKINQPKPSIKNPLDNSQAKNNEYSSSYAHSNEKINEIFNRDQIYEVIFGQTVIPSGNSNSNENEDNTESTNGVNDSRPKRTNDQSVVSGGDFPENNPSHVDSTMFLKDTQIQQNEEDDVIYIVENEELIAVK